MKQLNGKRFYFVKWYHLPENSLAYTRFDLSDISEVIFSTQMFHVTGTRVKRPQKYFHKYIRMKILRKNTMMFNGQVTMSGD